MQQIVAEMRFRYLSDWDPDALATMVNYDGVEQLLLHRITSWDKIQGFEMVLDAGMRHFPTKIGLLFHKDSDGETPFQKSCGKYGKVETMKAIENNCLGKNHDNYYSERNNIIRSILCAAVDENIHLDGIYILLRRQPDVLQPIGLRNRKRNPSDDDNDNKGSLNQEGVYGSTLRRSERNRAKTKKI